MANKSNNHRKEFGEDHACIRKLELELAKLLAGSDRLHLQSIKEKKRGISWVYKGEITKKRDNERSNFCHTFSMYLVLATTEAIELKKQCWPEAAATQCTRSTKGRPANPWNVNSLPARDEHAQINESC